MKHGTSFSLPTAFLAIAIALVGLTATDVAYAGTLSCSVTTSCPSGTIIYRISSTTNAHAELASQSNYTQLVCCTGVAGLGNSCAGTFTTALKLSGTSNAHAEENSQTNYANSACVSVPGGGTVSVGYQASNCTGFDTTLGSISASTNGHAGDGAAYTTKVCASATGVSQTLTMSISDNSIGFGTLSPAAARYATGDTTGSTTEAEGHTISASTNASNGYVITLNGATLASGADTITAIGSTNTASAAGTEQFGLRLTASGGNGAVSAPYAASGFAFDTGAFPDEVASDADGDDVTTTYSARYLGNVGAATEPGAYTATLTYVITASF